jgi:hypothetical protein
MQRGSEETQAQLARQGRTGAQQARVGWDTGTAMLGGAMEGYDRGRETRRTEEKHDREGKKLDSDLALSEEQRVSASLGNDDTRANQSIMNANGMDLRKRGIMAPINASEESILTGKSQRALFDKQTANFGQLTAGERYTREQNEKAQAMEEVNRLLLAAAKLPQGDPQGSIYMDEAARIGQKHSISTAGLDARKGEASSKAVADANSAITAGNLAATTDDTYKQVSPQLANFGGKVDALASRLDGFDAFKKASSIGTGEDAPLAQMVAGLPTEQATRITARMGDGNITTKTARAEAQFLQDIAQMDNELIMLKAQAQQARTPQAKQALQADIAAQEQKMRLIKGRLNPVAPGTNPARKYRQPAPQPQVLANDPINNALQNVNFGGGTR